MTILNLELSTKIRKKQHSGVSQKVCIFTCSEEVAGSKVSLLRRELFRASIEQQNAICLDKKTPKCLFVFEVKDEKEGVSCQEMAQKVLAWFFTNRQLDEANYKRLNAIIDGSVIREPGSKSYKALFVEPGSHQSLYDTPSLTPSLPLPQSPLSGWGLRTTSSVPGTPPPLTTAPGGGGGIGSRTIDDDEEVPSSQPPSVLLPG